MSSETDANIVAWNRMALEHPFSKFYRTDAVVSGQSSLHSVELELVGDCKGLSLLHLQCHFGLDTISWVREGAQPVVGVDFSQVAISQAQMLARQADIDARFVCSDVQSLELEEQFDLVVTTYGVICWLSDLKAWAKNICDHLLPEGRFIIVDFHPILEARFPGKMTGAESYFGHGKSSHTSEVGSYACPDSDTYYEQTRWQHTIADIINALIGAGLVLEEYHEYDGCSFELFPELSVKSSDLWRPGEKPVWPYMFALTAKRLGGLG